MLPQKPYAISCDRNSEPILNVFKEVLKGKKSLLEVAAGTGQHAIFMAPHFLEMTWTLADRKENHEGISMWLGDFPRTNIRGPYEYEIGKTPLPKGDFDCVYAANLIHMISWDLACKFFDDLASLPKDTTYLFYGAFNYNGTFSSSSNEKFDQWLKDKNPEAGLRDFEAICEELLKRSIELVEDRQMPANNRMLIFSKQ